MLNIENSSEQELKSEEWLVNKEPDPEPCRLDSKKLCYIQILLNIEKSGEHDLNKRSEEVLVTCKMSRHVGHSVKHDLSF